MSGNKWRTCARLICRTQFMVPGDRGYNARYCSPECGKHACNDIYNGAVTLLIVAHMVEFAKLRQDVRDTLEKVEKDEKV